MRILCAVCLAAGLVALPAPAQRMQYDHILGRIIPAAARTEYPIEQLDLSPDGKTLVSTGTGNIRILSFPDGKLVHKFPADTPQSLAGVGFTPDGKRVIAAQPGLRVWEVETGKAVLSVDWDWMNRPFTPPGDPKWPTTYPLFSPDRTRVYVTGPGDVVTAWDTATGKEASRSAPLGQRTYSMAVSPDGKYLAIGLRDGFRVWDAATLKGVFAKDLPAGGHTGRTTYRVSFHPDGKRVFVIGRSARTKVGWDDQLQVWDLTREKLEHEVLVSRHGHDAVVVLPGGRYGMVVSSRSRGCNVVDLTNGKMLGTIIINVPCHPMALTPDKNTFVMCSGSSYLSRIKVEEIMEVLPGGKKP